MILEYLFQFLEECIEENLPNENFENIYDQQSYSVNQCEEQADKGTASALD